MALHACRCWIEQTEKRNVSFDDVDLVLIAKGLGRLGRLVDATLFFGTPSSFVQVISGFAI
jgi:hypothetical protein